MDSAMREVTFEENVYRIGRLETMKQWHVARRLLPVITAIGKAAASSEKSISETEEQSESESQKFFDTLSGPLAKAFAAPTPDGNGMTDETSDYIIQTCLRCVHRQQKTGWAPLMNSGGSFMFEIGMATMIGLTVAVIQDNLANFFSGGLPASPAQIPTPASN